MSELVGKGNGEAPTRKVIKFSRCQSFQVAATLGVGFVLVGCGADEYLPPPTATVARIVDTPIFAPTVRVVESPATKTPTYVSPTLTQRPTATRPPTATREPTATLEGWQVPSIQQRIEWLRNPEFFRQPLGKEGRELLASQFDPRQWVGYSGNVSLEGFMNNACDLAVLTMAANFCAYCETGEVPYRIIDTLERLKDWSYTDVNGRSGPIIDHTQTSLMDYTALVPALRILLLEDQQKYTINELTPNLGSGTLYTLTEPQWATFTEGAYNVSNAGGFSIAFGFKYKWGHIVFLANSPRSQGEPSLVIDPRGPHNEGDIVQASIEDYFDPVEEHKSLAYAFGISPTELGH